MINFSWQAVPSTYMVIISNYLFKKFLIINVFNNKSLWRNTFNCYGENFIEKEDYYN